MGSSKSKLSDLWIWRDPTGRDEYDVHESTEKASWNYFNTPPLHNNFQTIFKNNKTTSLLFALYYHDKPFFISITLSFLISLELYREKNYFNTLILTYLYLGVASLHRLPGIIPHYHLHVFLNYRLISVNSQISLSV